MRAEFTKQTKLQAWRRARGRCEHCTGLLAGKVAHYDHINPDAFSGDRDLSNCQVLCVNCHDHKTHQVDIPAIAKSNRLRATHAGIRRDRTIRAWRNFSGEIVTKPRAR